MNVNLVISLWKRFKIFWHIHLSSYYHIQRLVMRIESWNIPNWKGPTGIIKSSSWLHAGTPQNQTLCLEALSKCALSSIRLSAVTTAGGSLSQCTYILTKVKILTNSTNMKQLKESFNLSLSWGIQIVLNHFLLKKKKNS